MVCWRNGQEQNNRKPITGTPIVEILKSQGLEDRKTKNLITGTRNTKNEQPECNGCLPSTPHFDVVAAILRETRANKPVNSPEMHVYRSRRVV